ncbi:MAG: lysophospholipid acyltransferase family protein [Thermodesulfobacteriota bacterium]
MIKKLLNGIGLALGPPLAAMMIRVIALTMRIEYVNCEDYRRLVGEGKNHILAFWHGRLFMMPLGYLGKKGVTILVSQHRDGELIARTVKRFNISSVRGSSTRGWFGGFKGLIRAARSGGDLAITPDGPQGPARRAQTGVVQLASKTGFPIVPMTFAASKKKFLAAGIPL